jgi:hypothetical protein
MAQVTEPPAWQVQALSSDPSTDKKKRKSYARYAYILKVFLEALGFELRTSHLLGRCP